MALRSWSVVPDGIEKLDDRVTDIANYGAGQVHPNKNGSLFAPGAHKPLTAGKKVRPLTNVVAATTTVAVMVNGPSTRPRGTRPDTQKNIERFMENEGALEVTVSLLQPEMDTFMWEKATGLLQAVAMNPSYRSAIGAQSIDHLLRILQQVAASSLPAEPGRSSLPSNLTSTLRHLSLNEANALKIAQSPGAMPSLAVLLSHESPVVRAMSASTIASIAHFEYVAMHAVDHGCVPKLVHMLTESTDDLGLLTSSGALFEISLHPCSRLAIVEARAVRPLIKILKTKPGSRSVAAKQELHSRMQEKASGVMLALCQATQFREPLSQNKALVDVIFAHIKMTNGTLISRSRLVECLFLLSMHFEASMAERAFPHIISLMHEDEAWHVRTLAVQLVTTLLTTEDYMWRFAIHGGLARLYAMLHDKGSDLQTYNLGAVLHLCLHPDVPTMLLEMGFVAKCEELLFNPRTQADIAKLATCCARAIHVYHREEIEAQLTTVELDTVLNTPPEFDGFLQLLIRRRKQEDYLGISELESQFSEAELAGFRKAFKEYDADASGTIDSEEIDHLMAHLGQLETLGRTHERCEERLRMFMNESDLNDDGELDFPEFLHLMKKVNEWRHASRYVKFKDGAKRGRLGRARKQYLKIARPKALKAEEEAERLQKEEAKKRERARFALKAKRAMQKQMGRERHEQEKEIKQERGGAL